MKIGRASEQDKNKILDLLNEVFYDQQRFDWKRDDSYWKWKYENIPFGKPVIHVAEENDQIIGSSTLWPWQFIVRGEIFNVYQPCDTVVHPDFQGKGIFSQLNKFRVPDINKLAAPFVFNFPNNNSVGGYLKFGWSYVEKIPWMIKVLRPIGTLQLFRSKQKSAPAKLAVKDQFDSALCLNLNQEIDYYKSYISTYRKEGYFKWRYEDHPFFNYGQVIVKQGRKEAGAIFSINEKGGSRELIVMELIGDTGLVETLFDAIKVKAKEYSVSYIICIYNKYYMMNKLYKKGYFKVRNKNMVLLPFDIRTERTLTNFDNWNICASMHDSV